MAEVRICSRCGRYMVRDGLIWRCDCGRVRFQPVPPTAAQMRRMREQDG